MSVQIHSVGCYLPDDVSESALTKITKFHPVVGDFHLFDVHISNVEYVSFRNLNKLVKPVDEFESREPFFSQVITKKMLFSEFHESQFNDVGYSTDVTMLKNWVNTQLEKMGEYIGNLCQDLRDGWNLALLLESLSGMPISRKKSRLRVDMVWNVSMVWDSLKHHQIQGIDTIRVEDIVDGNQTATKQLISLMKLHFEQLNETSEPVAKTAPCVNVTLNNGVDTGVRILDSNNPKTEDEKNASSIEQFRQKTQSSRENEDDVSSRFVASELFWQSRIESVTQNRLPYENDKIGTTIEWAISDWLQPLLNPSDGDAQRMLMDAFVIYIAKVLNDRTLSIGWQMSATPVNGEDEREDQQRVVVPMEITVAFDEPWSSVSVAIDNELVALERNSIVPFHFTHRNAVKKTIAPTETTGPWRIAISTTSMCCEPLGEVLTLQIGEQGQFRWIYNASRLNSDVVQRINEHLRELVNSLLAEGGEGTPICRLNMLPEKERTYLLKECNVVEDEPLAYSCLHHAFEERVVRAPTATAVIYEDTKVSYAELNVRANQLAGELIDLGVGPEKIVAVCVSPSIAMAVAIIAVLKAGGACMPMDTGYPSLRLIEILEATATKILIADDVGRDAVGDIDFLSVKIVDPTISYSRSKENPKVSGLTMTSMSYLMYTSGTTGRPKGVIIEHRNLVRLFYAMEAACDVDNTDTFCTFHSPAFVVSIWEFWAVMYHGARLVILPRHIARSPEGKYEMIRKHRVTVMNQTPSAFNILYQRYGKDLITENLRFVLFAGEPLDTSILRPLFAAHELTQLRFVNVYGCSETHYATCTRLTQQDTESSTIPVGRQFRDLTLYLLDSYGQPVPLGVIGEIYIGGAGVARGYYNMPELTNERFLPDPFSGKPGARMYKTGDLAKYLPDKSLGFISRDDRQVKIRGHRIEVAEVEAAIKRYGGVTDAHVLAMGVEPDKRLVAYLVAEASDNFTESIHLHLMQRLPPFMVPTAYVRMDKFPLTPNGKLDTRALPPIDETSLVRSQYEAPRDDIERSLAEIWQELLCLEFVSRHDSFFALGGNSLHAMRVIEGMRSRGYSIAVEDLYTHTVLSDLARTVEDFIPLAVPPNLLTPYTEKLTPKMLTLINLTQFDIDHIISMVPGGLSNIQDIYELSPMQEGILFHYLVLTESDPYLTMRQIRFTGRTELNRYIDAYQKVIDRHDILRTAFYWKGLSKPAQVVLRDAPLKIIEWDSETKENSICQELNARYGPRRNRIDLEKAPLVRFVAAREPDDQWIVLILIHHLVHDERTLVTMDTEILSYYFEPEIVLGSSAQFRRHIAYVRQGLDPKMAQEFFTKMLADIDESTLPFGLSDVFGDGTHLAKERFELGLELTEQLRFRSKALTVNPATLSHIAWALIVSRTSSTVRAVFGTVLFGRMRTGESLSSGIGPFINTLPVRLDVDETSITTCIRNTQMQLANLLKHEYASLALVQRCSRIASGTPLFSALLNYRYDSSTSDANDVETGFKILQTEGQTNYPLTLLINDNGIQLVFEIQVLESINPSRIREYLRETFKNMLFALETSPNVAISSIDILPHTEHELLIRTWNECANSTRDTACVHELFEQQVITRPSSTALIHENQRLSYADLNASANRLAYRLIQQGVGPESLVGLCVSISTKMMVGMLAILKAGGAYLPLDPNQPNQRLIDIVNDAALRIVIADEVSSGKLEIESAAIILVDANDSLIQEDTNPKVKNLKAHNLAYVIYTSGSTGKPKGVMIEHRNIVRLFDTNRENFDFDENDVWCLFHSIAFDVSVWEIWGAWLHGGQLVLMSRDVVRSPEATLSVICENHISVLYHTPSAFRASVDTLLVKSFPSHLRYVILGGESVDPSILHPLYVARGADLPQFINTYGNTETTVFTMVKVLTEDDTSCSLSLIGKRLPDSNIYLLDVNLKPAPLGAVGEIFVTGPGVSRGYLNRPELTRRKFLADPFRTSIDARMYRTGDLARYLANGELIYMGRNDQQIKVRGYRIETAEVEACLRLHDAVRDALVLGRGDERDRRLVAYVVADDHDDLVTTLRTHTAFRLPEYMVPSLILCIDAIPLNNNGKVDLRALPAPDDNALSRKTFEEPNDDVEKALATIWKELLGVDQISRHDSFFALGGHSLLAVRMIERMRGSGYQLSVNNVFLHPVLSDLATTIGDDRRFAVPANSIYPGMTELRPNMLPLIDLTQSDIDHLVSAIPGGICNIQDIYSLSPLQDGILFHHLLSTKGDPYLFVSQILFDDRFVMDRYVSAVQRVVDRHDALRTGIFWENLSTPAQIVFREARIPVIEFTLTPDEGPALNQLAAKYNVQSFRIDVRDAPLLRFIVAQEIDGRWAMLQIMHHMIADATVYEIMIAEIKEILNGRESNLPTPVPFRNLIASVRLTVEEDVHSRFFEEMLSDVDEPTLLYGLTEVLFGGSQTIRSLRSLSSQLTDRLRHHARNSVVSLATLFHLAWGLFVSRTTGRDDVVFGTVLFGRMNAGKGTEAAMGLFINTLPMRFNVDQTSVRESVQQMHLKLAELLRHEHASLSLAQRCTGLMSGVPLFNNLLNCRHKAVSVKVNEITSGMKLIDFEDGTNYPVGLAIDDDTSSLSLEARTVDSIDPLRIIGYMEQALQSVSNCLASNLPQSLHSIDVLPESERLYLIETGSGEEISQTEVGWIHRKFENQVTRIPDAIALTYNDESMSYKELNARANRLAHRLIELGVGPDTPVGICVVVSPALVVGILAVLKAGGCYVPVDPENPSQQLIDIIDDASPRVMIMDSIGLEKIGPDFFASKIVIDPNDSIERSEENPLVSDLRSDNLAYIIYTSGSTGLPKGVMVEHRNVVSVFEATALWFRYDPCDVWCLLHTVAFDCSVYEMWAPFYFGVTLALVSRDVVRSPEALYSAICDHRVTVMIQTPTAFSVILNVFVEKHWPKDLRYVIIGAEALDPSILRPMISQQVDNSPRFVNQYGPTETTIYVTFKEIDPRNASRSFGSIGKPLANRNIYLLDEYGRPVPVGAVGEIYIGGVSVTRGYLNKSEQTAEHFLPDPFNVSTQGRMYKTGDLAKFSPDGDLMFMGRNDQQVKIRGFRVEVGQVETRLKDHPAVIDSRVLILGTGLEKRLVAYVVTENNDDIADQLRSHLVIRLPEYMIPSAFVRVDKFPLTRNGKLDVRALPKVDESSLVRGIYETPKGKHEICLAEIWKKLLHLESVSRNDSFFALGGHSLLAIRVIESMRAQGLTISIQDLFKYRVLRDVARTVVEYKSDAVPENVLTPNSEKLTPDMLPLIDLTQSDIDDIISKVPGGLANIQDIYELSPTQDGILFHHLLSGHKNPYLIMKQVAFDDVDELNKYLTAFQRVVDRHDIFRTAIFWEGLSVPAQVVLRRAAFIVDQPEIESNVKSVREELEIRFGPRHYRMNLNKAPLIHFVIARDESDRWIMLNLTHHLILDERTQSAMDLEILAYLNGTEESLGISVPYRNHIARVRYDTNSKVHTEFFSEMLADVHEPTLPFGLMDVFGDDWRINSSILNLDSEFSETLRSRSQRLEVSLATVCHLAWALVISRTSNKKRVVFGTVLFGRTKSGETSSVSMGMFINTLPIRLDIDDTPVDESVRHTHTTLSRLLEHEHASLALAQRCSGMGNGISLFSSLLNYVYNLSTSVATNETSHPEVLKVQGSTNYPLVISIEDDMDRLALVVQVSEPISSLRVCGYTKAALVGILNALTEYPNATVSSLDIMPEDERLLVLKTWNRTEELEPNPNCIHQLFEEQVEQTPSATALIYEGQAITYAELNARANGLAHRLIKLGVVPDRLVGICMSVSLEMLIGLLAILKAGGGYVPLDPTNPEQRLSDILADGELSIMIADRIGRQKLDSELCSRIVFVDPYEPQPSPEINVIVFGLSPRNVAYVIYTSGSTGRPKGVLVEHRTVVRLFDTTDSCFRFDQQDVWCLFHSIAFDFSVWEIWGALRYGGRLVLMSRDVIRAPEASYRMICEHRVTVLNQTPSAFNANIVGFMSQSMPNHLRYVIFGGEALKPSSLHPLFVARNVRPPRFFNMFGTTETTVHATLKELTQDDTIQSFSPIGRPLSDMKMYLLDDQNRPVPLGATGEMYIGGSGVSRGYFKRPDLNRERFIVDPFSECVGARMYKTGDLARYLPDGNLVFEGRNDQQIKIRGFRIEAGEIETCLRSHPMVNDAFVLAMGDDSKKRLIAYVVGDPSDDLAERLQVHLSASIPEYMIPSAFVRLDEFPLTPNGKLNIRALPMIDDNSFVRKTYEAPNGVVETSLARIWEKLLDFERVGRHDSFFALGGHSLLAIRLIEAMRCQGFTLTIRNLFEHPVLCDLARTVGEHVPVVDPCYQLTRDHLTPDNLPLIDLMQTDIDIIVSRVPGGLTNIQDVYALSPLQDGILFHHLLSTDGDSYLRMALFAFGDYEKLNKYVTAYQRVVDRHDILRTAIFWEGLSVPAQVVLRQAPLSIVELALETDDASAFEQLSSRFSPKRYRIDLTDAPLVRFVIARENDGRWILLTVIHHLIFDDRTDQIIQSEIRAFVRNNDAILEVPIPYRNYIAMVRQGFSEEMHERFFKEMLMDIDEPTLPYGFNDVWNGTTIIASCSSEIDEELINKLRVQSKIFDVSLATLCHLAWALVVSRTSGQMKTVFGTVLFGRMLTGESSIVGVGLFINTLPIRLDIDETPLQTCVRNVQIRLAKILEHENASLSLAQRCSNIANGTPLFTSILNYRRPLPKSDDQNEFNEFEVLHTQSQTSYPLVISFDDDGHSFEMSVEVFESMEPNRISEYVKQAFENLLKCLRTFPQTPVHALDILPSSERTLLLEQWNCAVRTGIDPTCIHQIFEQQVVRSPSTTAVVYEDQLITYAELNVRANRLAHHLIQMGVLPDSLVGICATVSPTMLVGILAILKAGGAYVPLESDYPYRRLVDIIYDAPLRIVIADEVGREKLLIEKNLELIIVDPNVPCLRVLSVRSHSDFQATSAFDRLASTGMPNLQ